MKIRVLAALLALNASAAMADVGWTDWTSVTAGASGSGTGTITVGADTVGVSLAGMVGSFVDGDGYYNNSSTGYTSVTGTFAGLKPSDLIQEWGVGRVTLTFDQAVVDPYVALVSVGQGYGVTYGFSAPVSVVSYGPNYWGYGHYSVSGNSFTGYEYNGIVKFSGTFTSLTFDISPGEYWHGFNVGVAGVAPPPVPEPETYAMMMAGLGLLGAVVRRRKAA